MSSWLSLSLPNPFKSPPADDNPSPPPSPVSGDLSVLISRQLRGVASFLSPPPSNSHSDELPPSPPPSSSQRLAGIKKDLAEIGGSFKSSLSILSTNKAVTEISKFASNLLQFDNQQDENVVVGISDQVIDFVGKLSLRPELWTEFPLSINKDLDISDMQRNHASTIEHLVPSLADLRHKIECYISKEQFWIIYFVLLLPRLNDDVSELLSTPEVVEVREILLQKLKSKQNTPVEVSEEHEGRNVDEAALEINNTQEMKNPSPSNMFSSDNLNAPRRKLTQYHENSEPSPSEEDVNTGIYRNTRNKQIKNEDDISFSDLEDEINDLSSRMSGNRVSSPSQIKECSSRRGSSEWVQLKENSENLGWLRKDRRSTDREKDSGSEDSNDWLTVDKIDSD